MRALGVVMCGLVLGCGVRTEPTTDDPRLTQDIAGNPSWDTASGTWKVEQPQEPDGTGGAESASTQTVTWASPWVVFDDDGNETCEGSCSLCDPLSGICYIICRGDNSCGQADLVCPDDHPCRVICEGRASCQQADILCPPSFPCLISCDGSGACNQVGVECEEDDPCGLTCFEGSCTQAKFDCEGANCVVQCIGDQTCTQLRR